MSPRWNAKARAAAAERAHAQHKAGQLGRRRKYPGLGKMIAIKARWPEGLRSQLIEHAGLDEDASDQMIIDALVILPNLSQRPGDV